VSRPQDYRNAGNLAMGVMDALTRTVYDPKNTSLTVSKPLPLNRSKDRTCAFVRAQAPGGDNKSRRALVNAATELAHSVKRRSHLHAKRLGAPGMVRSGRDLRHQ
jgi:hypothetical protein